MILPNSFHSTRAFVVVHPMYGENLPTNSVDFMVFFVKSTILSLMYITKLLSPKTWECLSKLFEPKNPPPRVVLRSAKISASLVPRNSDEPRRVRGAWHQTNRRGETRQTTRESIPRLAGCTYLTQIMGWEMASS